MIVCLKITTDKAALANSFHKHSEKVTVSGNVIRVKDMAVT